MAALRLPWWQRWPDPMQCPICRSSDLTPVPFDRIPEVDVIVARHGLGAGYGWLLCRTCGNAAPSEQPDRAVLSEYWQTNRTTSDAPAAWEYRRKIARIGAERSWARFAPLYTGAKPGRFLDIACGLGATVRRFQDGGWTASGIDADGTTKVHHDHFGIDTRIGQIEDQTWPDRFDLVQIAYAIYFITDPGAYLARLRDVIAPDGTLAIVMADLLASTQQGGPSYLHTWLPTPESLQVALSLAGYRTVLCERVHDSWFIAAKPGQSAPPPINGNAIWLAHRTREMRWRAIGAPRARLKRLIAPVLLRWRHPE